MQDPKTIKVGKNTCIESRIESERERERERESEREKEREREREKERGLKCKTQRQSK